MSAPNLMTLTKRTSLNVYGADIFTCSRQAARAPGAPRQPGYLCGEGLVNCTQGGALPL